MKVINQEEVEKHLPKKYYVRDIHERLITDLGREEVMILYGSRQVGKSVEVWKMIERLLAKDNADIFYFNFDVLPERVEDPDNFLNLILSLKNKEKTYVFIDEAQRLKGIGLWIKYLYDKKENVKWILTGSASLDLKNKVKESLMGRKIEYYLEALTLGEILRDEGIEVEKIRGSFAKLDKIIEEYMRFGGYPGVRALTGYEDKTAKLRELVDSYVVSDIAQLYEISDKKVLKMVASYLAENIGNLLSKENLAQTLRISKREVEKCLEALEGSFLLREIGTFSTDKTRELTHRPKIYFEDLGIRNAIVEKLGEGRLLMDKGKLWENLVVKLAAEKWGWDKIRFWRTVNQTELDVVVMKNEGRIEAMEAKYQEPMVTPRNVKSFSEKYEKILDRITTVSTSNWWELMR